MCHVMQINRSGFYAWLAEPKSRREIEDERLLGQIKQFWIESGFSYGYRNITKDLKDTGETCGKNRVNRIMRQSRRRYKRHRGFRCGQRMIIFQTSHSKEHTPRISKELYHC
ncbi:MAG: putative transposase [Arenicella sp.]|jgi:putative transposase